MLDVFRTVSLRRFFNDFCLVNEYNALLSCAYNRMQPWVRVIAGRILPPPHFNCLVFPIYLQYAFKNHASSVVFLISSIFVAFVLEAFMLQYTFSKTKYEAALEKKIQETGAGSQM